MKYHVRGMWIRVDIEFCFWRHIPWDTQCSTHNHHFAYVFGNAWFLAQGHRDVSERSNRDENNFSGCSHYFFDYQVYCMLTYRLELWLRKLYTSESIVAMHIVGDYRLAYNWPVASTS